MTFTTLTIRSTAWLADDPRELAQINSPDGCLIPQHEWRATSMFCRVKAKDAEGRRSVVLRVSGFHAYGGRHDTPVSSVYSGLGHKSFYTAIFVLPEILEFLGVGEDAQVIFELVRHIGTHVCYSSTDDEFGDVVYDSDIGEDDDGVDVDFASTADGTIISSPRLVPAEGITLQPHSQAFLKIYEPERWLQEALRAARITVMNRGQSLTLRNRGNEFVFDVVECEPRNRFHAVHLIDVDVPVEFKVPKDYVPPPPVPPPALLLPKATNASAAPEEDHTAYLAQMQAAAVAAAASPSGVKVPVFTGEGHALTSGASAIKALTLAELAAIRVAALRQRQG